MKVKWYNSKAAIRVWVALLLFSVVIFFIGLQGVLGSVFPPLDFLSFISAKRFSAMVRELVFWASKRVTIDLVLIGLGLWGMYVAVKRGLYSVLTVLKPSSKDDLVGNVYERIKLTRGPKIAVLGGSTGIVPVLNGLKKYTSNIDAIILPTERNIRSALTALADTRTLNKLFSYRFENTKLSGLSFGDIYIKAMRDVSGDVVSALKESSNVFSLSGRICPLTKEALTLEFKTDKGIKVADEAELIKHSYKISSVKLADTGYKVNHEALDIIRNADAVIIGPGSLYSTILPSLLVKGVPEALFASRGIKIFVPNLMAQKYEPDRENSVSAQIETLFAYAGEPVVDSVAVNNAPVPEEVLVKYRYYKAMLLNVDEEAIRDLGIGLAERGMLTITENGLIRHDAQALGRALIKLISI